MRAFTTEQATFACLFAEKKEQGSEVRGGRLPSAPSMNGLCDDAGRGVRGDGVAPLHKCRPPVGLPLCTSAEPPIVISTTPKTLKSNIYCEILRLILSGAYSII